MCSLGEEYEIIARRALTVPVDTAALMELMRYVDTISTETLVLMEERLRHVMEYILFLSDHYLTTPVEMKQNNITFLWYLRMPTILEEHREMVDSKMEELQAALTLKIQKFIEDLQLYAKLVDELENNGNIDDLPKYHRKAKKLDERLIAAMDRINEFNEEETAFGFELSQYPLRKQTHDKLTPYKKLYDNSTEFLEKQELWLKSQVGSHDPEQIETDVGQFYRNVYKLEKFFVDKPVAQGLAINVSRNNMVQIKRK